MNELTAIAYGKARLVGVLVLLAALSCCRSLAQGPSEPQNAIEPLSADELESDFGLQVSLIGVTAGGGMIDFRLEVLDAEKAKKLLWDPARKPTLIAVKSGIELTNPSMEENGPALADGDIIFALFPNSGSAIRPGDELRVAFGTLHLEPMPAQ